MKEEGIVSLQELLKTNTQYSFLGDLMDTNGLEPFISTDAIKISASSFCRTIIAGSSCAPKGGVRLKKGTGLSLSVVEDKKNKLVEYVLAQVFESLQQTLAQNFHTLSSIQPTKPNLLEAIEILSEHYDSVNEELFELEKAYFKYLGNACRLENTKLSPAQFVTRAFSTLPEIKDFFKTFDYNGLSLQEIVSLQCEFCISEHLFDLEGVLKHKKAKRRKNKIKNRKKNKATNIETCASESNQSCVGQPADYESVVSFLVSMSISGDRQQCRVGNEWLEKLSRNKVQ